VSRRTRACYLDDRLLTPRDWLGLAIPLAIVGAFIVLGLFHYLGVLS
jgi:hypothetical protein